MGNCDCPPIKGGNASGRSPTYCGSSTGTYDGTTVKGPPSWLNTKGLCPERLPKQPRLKATATNLGKDRYAIKVTANPGRHGIERARPGLPPGHAGPDRHAGRRRHHHADGIAVIKARNPHQSTTIKVGYTMQPLAGSSINATSGSARCASWL